MNLNYLKKIYNKIKKQINFILKHDNPTDVFIKEQKKLYGNEFINSLN